MKTSGGTSAQDGGLPSPAAAGITVATAAVDVRLDFLKKVYTILTINFMITVAVSCCFTFIDSVRSYVLNNFWVILVALIATFVFIILLSCVRLSHPFDIIVLYCFVLSMSCAVGTIVARYYDSGQGMIVLQAFLATAAVFLGITIYVAVSGRDFSFLGGFLAAASLALFILIIFNFVLAGIFVRGKTRRVISFAISVAGALLMIGYILYDTSLVINRFGPDLWLAAVVALYTDVINLFLFFLNIFSFISN